MNEPLQNFDPILDWALYYASLGWSVFPVHGIGADGSCTCSKKSECDRPGKHPMTEHGSKDATTDPKIIQSWWHRWPSANIGVRTGQDSRIVTIDCDGPEGKKSFDEKLSAEPTCCFETGRLDGGIQYVFAYPKEGGPVKSGTKLLPGIDSRGDGGYFVAPPSLHFSGKRYRWLISPAKQSPASLQNFVLDLINRKNGHDNNAFGSGIFGDPVEKIPEGARNDTLFRLGCSMRRNGFSEQAIFAALRETNAERCSPKLEDEELKRIASSTMRFPPSGGSTEVFVIAAPPDNLDLVPLIKNFAVEKCVTLLAGKSGTFKSLYTQWTLNYHDILSLYLVDLDLSNYMFHVRQQTMGKSSVIPLRINPDANIFPNFRLERFWSELGKKVIETGAKVVVFDTLLDFLEGDFSRAGDLNLSMQRCRDFAAKYNVAIILITHTTKISWNRDDLELSDVADSRIVTTKSDLVLGFQSGESGNDSRCVFLRIKMLKSRIGELSEPFVFKVDTPKTHPQGLFNFEKTDEKFPSKESSAVDEAIVDLEELLREGPRPVKEATDCLSNSGHSPKIIRQARERVCASKKVDGVWIWELNNRH